MIKVYPKQAEMIKAMCFNQRTVCLAVRQCGKCLDGSAKIKIRNKKTGEIEEITVQEFFERFDNQK